MPSQSMKHFTENLMEALDNPVVIHKIAHMMEEHLVTENADASGVTCTGVIFHTHHLHEEP